MGVLTESVSFNNTDRVFRLHAQVADFESQLGRELTVKLDVI